MIPMIPPELHYRTVIVKGGIFNTEADGKLPKFLGRGADIIDYSTELMLWETKISFHIMEDDQETTRESIIRPVKSALVRFFSIEPDDYEVCGILSPFASLTHLYVHRAISLDSFQEAGEQNIWDIWELATHAEQREILSGWTVIEGSEEDSRQVFKCSGKRVSPPDRAYQQLQSLLVAVGHTSLTVLGDLSGTILEHPEDFRLLAKELGDCMTRLAK